ncbi:MAG: DUF3276 family protein [bacterium]|nr:DUF3276 family protein [bacterium]
MQEFAAPLFSTKMTSGRRTFFFDVRNTKEAKPYLKITQSSINGEEKKRINLAVFDSEISEFKNALTQALDYFENQVK